MSGLRGEIFKQGFVPQFKLFNLYSCQRKFLSVYPPSAKSEVTSKLQKIVPKTMI